MLNPHTATNPIHHSSAIRYSSRSLDTRSFIARTRYALVHRSNSIRARLSLELDTRSFIARTRNALVYRSNSKRARLSLELETRSNSKRARTRNALKLETHSFIEVQFHLSGTVSPIPR